jgi:hypothetical protein
LIAILPKEISLASTDWPAIAQYEGQSPGRVAIRLGAAGEVEARLREVAEWRVKHCPVCDALERPVPLTTEVAIA